jgi:hypothetical protein
MVSFCPISRTMSGILRAYNGHVAGVNGGHSRSLVVTRGHTKTLANKGFWCDFPEHPTAVVVQTPVIEWVRWLDALSAFIK